MSKPIKDKELDLLIKKTRNGDRDAFDKILDAYHPGLFRYCFYLTKTTQRAEDLAQETFIIVFKKIKFLNHSNAFKSWIHQIAHRAHIDYIRLKKNQKTQDINSIIEQGKDDRSVETKDLVHKILDTLDSLEKQILLMIDLADFSYKDAATTLDLNESEVTWRLRTARNKFKEYLERNKIEVTGVFNLPKDGKDSA